MSHRGNHSRMIAGGLILLLGSGCATLQRYGTVAGLPSDPTRELAAAMFTPETIDKVGDWAATVWLSKQAVEHGTANTKFIDAIKGRLIDAATHSEDAEAATQMNWRFTVIKSAEDNAVAVPGGNVIVYAGTLAKSQKNPDRLAVTICHEMIHALKRDAARRISVELQEQVMQGVAGGTLTRDGLSPEATTGIMVAMGLSAGANIVPFARDQESVADHGGLLLMGRAGFNPEAAVNYWKEKPPKKSKVPLFLRMHPADEDRITQLNGWMPEALGFYRLANAQSARPSHGGNTP